MRHVRLLIVLLVALLALPAAAQDAITTITYNGLSLIVPASLAAHANLVNFPGDPPDLQAPGGPEAPHLRVSLFSDVPSPDSLFNSVATVRLYRISDIVNYPAYADAATRLQAILADRYDMNFFMIANPDSNENVLPFLPVFPAAQVIRARAMYYGTDAFNGVSYITVYRQDVSPFVATDFLYTFQAVSRDNVYYLSVTVPLTTTLFPAEIGEINYDEFVAGFTEYLNTSVATLNAAQPTDFTPDLATVEALVGGIGLSS
jgi:hypothetical protein